MDEKLISDLGGINEVAAALDQRRNTVANWTKRNIPWRWRHKVADLAEQKGIELPAAFLETRQ